MHWDRTVALTELEALCKETAPSSVTANSVTTLHSLSLRKTSSNDRRPKENSLFRISRTEMLIQRASPT